MIGPLLVLITAFTKEAAAQCPSTFQAKWGTAGSGDGQFNAPHNVALDAAGNVYVTDSINRRVQKFTSEGVFILKWGLSGSGNGQFNDNRGVATNAAGDTIYVADGGNNRIQMFSPTGSYLGKWGGLGTANGLFDFPSDVATDDSGNVFVVDSHNNRMQKFDSAGGWLATWGGTGTGDGLFTGPQGVATDGAGNVYVTEFTNHRVQKFTNAGTFMLKWGSFGTETGKFNRPNAVTVDAAGDVYVSDQFNHRIQKFTEMGVPLCQWGGGGSGSGNGQFNNPNGVVTDGSGSLYVVDQSNNRVQKFAPTCASPSACFAAWWPAENSALDTIGLNGGTLMNGATYGAGMVGAGFHLDGVDDFVELSPTPSMDFGTEDFSIEGWINLHSTAGDQSIIHKVTGQYPDDYTYFVEFQDEPDYLRFMVHATTANENDLLVPVSLSTETWYHIAAVRAGNTNRLYLDGALIGTQTAGTNVNTGLGGSARIGQHTPNGVSGINRPFNGRIDELSLYCQALSGAEILSLYTAGPFGKCLPACSDGLDNDGDGCADYPADQGCSSAGDNSEAEATCTAVSFSSGAYTFAEGNGLVTVTVNRTGSSSGVLRVDCSTQNVTGLAGSDYGAVPTRLFWEDGDMIPKSFQIYIYDDSGIEGGETFQVNLSNPSPGASLGAHGSAVVTINDNDPVQDPRVCDGGGPGPKIMLHLASPTSKNQCAAGRVPCGNAVVTGGLYPSTHFAYVLVAGVSADDGIAGVSFGIDYGSGAMDGVGVDIFEWNLCAAVEFGGFLPVPAGGDSPPTPPGGGSRHFEAGPSSITDVGSGRGNMIVWDWTSSSPLAGCQRTEPGGPGTGVVAVAGYFYLTAYSPARLEVIPRPVDNVAAITICPHSTVPYDPIEFNVSASNLGAVGFGGEPGSNPCAPIPPTPPPSPATCSMTPGEMSGLFTWSPVAEATNYLVSRNDTLIAILPSGTTSYEDFPKPGVYDYSVRAATPCAVSDPCTDSARVSDVDEKPSTTPPFTLLPPVNPASLPVGIAFELPAPGAIRIEIFDVSGRQVQVMSEGTYAAGRHSVAWDGRDLHGRSMPGGLYFIRLVGHDAVRTRRLILLR